MEAALREAVEEVIVERVVLLGAGGTARAALAAAARLGASRITVVARRVAAVDELRPVAAALGVEVTHAPWPAVPTPSGVEVLSGADLIISTVPKGVADPLADAIRWRSGALLLDALYDPWPTPLAAAARAGGVRVVSGLDLLLAQAVGQFEALPACPPQTRCGGLAAAGVTGPTARWSGCVDLSDAGRDTLIGVSTVWSRRQRRKEGIACAG